MFVPVRDHSNQHSIFECNLELVFSSIFRLNYILFEDILKDDDPNFTFLESTPVTQSFGKRLFLIPRQRILAPLVIRTAKEEDSDDLTAICNSQSELCTDQHGNHFISEMISSQDSDKMCLVAEDEDRRVVGMMTVSLRMDLSLLEQHFDLRPFGLFCKGDFCESVQAFQRHEQERHLVSEEIGRAHLAEKNKILRRMCSYQQNVRLLQTFAKEHVEPQMKDFNVYSEEKGSEKKKGLSQNILGKLVEKHLKLFKFDSPDDVFERIADDQVRTFIISAGEFLFRELKFFGLPRGYLEGQGHWREWALRQIKSKLEEQRSKGLLGKRRAKGPKKKRHDEGRANEILLPSGFDIEPFCRALGKFIEADADVRAKAAKFVLQNEKKLFELFCEKNGELVEDRQLQFEAVVEGLEAGGFKLPESVKSNLLPILRCFGSLKCETQKVLLKEKKKFRFVQNKERTVQAQLLKQKVRVEPKFRLNEKTVHLVRLQDLLEAIDRIRHEDSFFSTRLHNLVDLEKIFQEEEQEALGEVSHEYGALGLEHYEGVRQRGVEESIRTVPPDVLNAACISIFFMEKEFEQRATDFLPFIFSQIRSRDYLILTQPQLANETPLLGHFDLVPKKPSSNFGHALYFFHRSNLFAQFLKVVPALPDEIDYLDRKLFPRIAFDDQKQLREDVRERIEFRLSRDCDASAEVKDIFVVDVDTKPASKAQAPGQFPTSRIDLRLKEMYAHSVKRGKTSNYAKWSNDRSRFFRFDLENGDQSKDSVEKSSTRRKRLNLEKRRSFAKAQRRRLARRRRDRRGLAKSTTVSRFSQKSGTPPSNRRHFALQTGVRMPRVGPGSSHRNRLHQQQNRLRRVDARFPLGPAHPLALSVEIRLCAVAAAEGEPSLHVFCALFRPRNSADLWGLRGAGGARRFVPRSPFGNPFEGLSAASSQRLHSQRGSRLRTSTLQDVDEKPELLRVAAAFFG